MLSEITPKQLKEKLAAGENLQLIDVREPDEFEICKIEASQLIPLGEIPGRVGEVDKTRPVVVICHHGFRSAQAIQYLSQRFGYDNLLNLKGGIHEWALQVDPGMQVY
ncbi:rhodanese-like domain-containing protein [Adhaeribacter soli]|uniref:Rhodanese n=1 Tax=Adhaeribacter soli TaxID=2607655 RepID=A0A5N1IU34_9BACT|nr:rhodanese-like domain-containing protein [Adhaeribacter soli]KAA9333705.1 rhodanese [Adhaeribacter soli]